jgi:hypothetical protein
MLYWLFYDAVFTADVDSEVCVSVPVVPSYPSVGPQEIMFGQVDGFS